MKTECDTKIYVINRIVRLISLILNDWEKGNQKDCSIDYMKGVGAKYSKLYDAELFKKVKDIHQSEEDFPMHWRIDEEEDEYPKHWSLSPRP